MVVQFMMSSHKSFVRSAVTCEIESEMVRGEGGLLADSMSEGPQKGTMALSGWAVDYACPHKGVPWNKHIWIAGHGCDFSYCDFPIFTT